MPEEVRQVSPKSHYVSLASHSDPNPFVESLIEKAQSTPCCFILGSSWWVQCDFQKKKRWDFVPTRVSPCKIFTFFFLLMFALHFGLDEAIFFKSPAQATPWAAPLTANNNWWNLIIWDCWRWKLVQLTSVALVTALDSRDKREWVFEVREVKSEKEKLSLFFEKC